MRRHCVSLFLDIEKPSTSKELQKKLSADGKLDMDDKSKDDILKD